MAEESKYNGYNECYCLVGDGSEIHFYVDEKKCIVTNNNGNNESSKDYGIRLLEYNEKKRCYETKKIFDEETKKPEEVENLINDLIVDTTKKSTFEIEDIETEGICDTIYQMFGVNEDKILSIIALKFLVNGVKDKVRLFSNVPSEEQLKQLAMECSKEPGECVIFPIPFKDHFTTGICDKGVFYIFDSTRQETEEKVTEINGIKFNTLYNNKKFQSELTGTCGFWTLYFCLEFADFMKTHESFSDVMSELGNEEFLRKVGNKVYKITGNILNNNEENICSILKGKDITFEYFVETILKDVQESKKGVPLYYDGSIGLRKMIDKNTTQQLENGQQLLNDITGAIDSIDDNLALDEFFEQAL